MLLFFFIFFFSMLNYDCESWMDPAVHCRLHIWLIGDSVPPRSECSSEWCTPWNKKKKKKADLSGHFLPHLGRIQQNLKKKTCESFSVANTHSSPSLAFVEVLWMLWADWGSRCWLLVIVPAQKKLFSWCYVLYMLRKE